MQQGRVYRNNIYVGIISKFDDESYSFQYDKDYFENEESKAISINLKLQEEPHTAPYLFSFFFNLLAEGETKDIECKKLRIDKNDHFSRLLKTTANNTIGSITIKEVLSV